MDSFCDGTCWMCHAEQRVFLQCCDSFSKSKLGSALYNASEKNRCGLSANLLIKLLQSLPNTSTVLIEHLQSTQLPFVDSLCCQPESCWTHVDPLVHVLMDNLQISLGVELDKSVVLETKGVHLAITMLFRHHRQQRQSAVSFLPVLFCVRALRPSVPLTIPNLVLENMVVIMMTLLLQHCSLEPFQVKTKLWDAHTQKACIDLNFMSFAHPPSKKGKECVQDLNCIEQHPASNGTTWLQELVQQGPWHCKRTTFGVIYVSSSTAQAAWSMFDKHPQWEPFRKFANKQHDNKQDLVAFNQSIDTIKKFCVMSISKIIIKYIDHNDVFQKMESAQGYTAQPFAAQPFAAQGLQGVFAKFQTKQWKYPFHVFHLDTHDPCVVKSSTLLRQCRMKSVTIRMTHQSCYIVRQQTGILSCLIMHSDDFDSSLFFSEEDDSEPSLLDSNLFRNKILLIEPYNVDVLFCQMFDISFVSSEQRSFFHSVGISLINVISNVDHFLQGNTECLQKDFNFTTASKRWTLSEWTVLQDILFVLKNSGDCDVDMVLKPRIRAAAQYIASRAARNVCHIGVQMHEHLPILIPIDTCPVEIGYLSVLFGKHHHSPGDPVRTLWSTCTAHVRKMWKHHFCTAQTY